MRAKLVEERVDRGDRFRLVELGAWPTPGTTRTSRAGATVCIRAAVAALSRSLFSPRTTSSGFCAQSGEEAATGRLLGVAPAVWKGSAIAMS